MAIACDCNYGSSSLFGPGAKRLRDACAPAPKGTHMNLPDHHTPNRDTSGFLLNHSRAVPVVETPSRWPELFMTMFYLAACGLAAFLVFSA
jgi:hypothetical protein